MLKVYNRSTGEEMAVNIEDIMRVEKKTYNQAEATHYQRTYVLLCNPCYGKWMDVSEEYNKVIDKYRGKAKLVKYTPTVYDLEQLKVNPDHINDMPRWYVPGLDRALSSDELERRMKTEFVSRYDAEDPAIISMVNKYNRSYKIVKVA
jgi:hypothetical protein